MGPRATTERHAAIATSTALATLLVLLGSARAGRCDPKPEIARGKLLVASDQLADPNFQQTVVLVLEYAPSGALGVIINRPTDVKLATLLPEVDELRDRDDTVLLGGPVARDRMILLLRTAKPPAESERIVDGVFITSSIAALHELPRDKHAASAFRAYVGYAGWGPQQLEAEVERGDWHVLAADAAILFDKPPARVWRELNERSSGEWVREQTLPTLASSAHRRGPGPAAPAATAQRSIGGVALPPPARNA